MYRIVCHSKFYPCHLQVLTVWDWTMESDSPLCHTILSTDYGRQSFLTFHPTDHTQLVSNSDDTAVFYHWVSLIIAPFVSAQFHIFAHKPIYRKDPDLIFTLH